MTRRAFERTHKGWVHIAESAQAYIEWDTTYYGHRNANTYLKYRGSVPIFHHIDKGPLDES